MSDELERRCHAKRDRGVLLELPLLGYVFAPAGTQDRVNRFKACIGRKGRTAVVIGATVIGLFHIARGVITLL